MKIEDNFLNKTTFERLKNHIMGSYFYWYCVDRITAESSKDEFQFIHMFYGSPWEMSSDFEALHPILETINPLVLWKIKGNLLTKTRDTIKHGFHFDIEPLIDNPKKLSQWTTPIFYVNTNNGYTEFEDGTKVESIANRMVTFPSNIEHRGTSCTDENKRVVINFNYFK